MGPISEKNLGILIATQKHGTAANNGNRIPDYT